MTTGFTQRLRGKIDVDFAALWQNGIRSIAVFHVDGPPVSGPSGTCAGAAGTGALLARDDGVPSLFQNTGTAADPIWSAAPQLGAAAITSGAVYDVAIDDSVIGATTPAAGSFTTLYSASSPHVFDQPVASAKTTSTMLTAAELLTGIITVNPGGGAPSALQLPSAAALDTATSALGAGGGPMVATDAFDFSVINTSTTTAESASIVINGGWTLVGNMVIPANDAAGARSAASFRATKRGAAHVDPLQAGVIVVNDESEWVAFFGGAEPGSSNYADIVAVDADILEVLAARKEGTPMPLALTDAQLSTLTDAAALLPRAARDSFLRAVAAHLGGEVDDAALLLAVNAALDDIVIAVAS